MFQIFITKLLFLSPFDRLMQSSSMLKVIKVIFLWTLRIIYFILNFLLIKNILYFNEKVDHSQIRVLSIFFE